MRDFRKYDVWINGIECVDILYESLEDIPKSEQYGMISQMTRAAVSIPSNIAEGCSRSSAKDFKRFLEYSLGSCFELETQLIICKKRKFVNDENYHKLIELLVILQKQLSALIAKLKL